MEAFHLEATASCKCTEAANFERPYKITAIERLIRKIDLTGKLKAVLDGFEIKN